MSTFAVKIVRIAAVFPHPNADRLELVNFVGMDWQCIIQKGSYAPGNLAVYFPIDSVLPEALEARIFGPDSKVKLSGHRIRTIKLRGALSQGLLVNLATLNMASFTSGEDVTSILGVTKYEPPVKGPSLTVGKSTQKQPNPNFRKYTGIENAKNYNNVFEDGQLVYVTEKIHGTNFRAGYVPYHANTILKKVLKFFGLAPEYEFVYGSHNVQLQNSLLYGGYYATNVYAKAVKDYNLKTVLKPGEVVYGEIYGGGIQKGYDYGQTEPKLVLFDVMKDGEYLNFFNFSTWAWNIGLPTVPHVWSGPYSKAKIAALIDGPSFLYPGQKVREGVVVKPAQEQTCHIGRKMLKFISDDYLLKNQDDETVGH